MTRAARGFFPRRLGSWFGGSRKRRTHDDPRPPRLSRHPRARGHGSPNGRRRPNASLAESGQQIFERGYSRTPLYEGTMDTSVGVLHVKDLLAHREEKPVWEAMRRPVLFVPENQRLNELFQRRAIVLDEFGRADPSRRPAGGDRRRDSRRIRRRRRTAADRATRGKLPSTDERP